MSTDMKKDIKNLFAENVNGFRLPRYSELPTVGLYLEQVAKYINGYITQIGFSEITTSMISNYVKKGIVSAPVKKQYNEEIIAHLIFISMAKSVVSIDHISHLFDMKRATYDSPTAYDYFCNEFENMLAYSAGIKDHIEVVGKTESETKMILRSVIVALSHLTFVNYCFEIARQI